MMIVTCRFLLGIALVPEVRTEVRTFWQKVRTFWVDKG